MVVLLAALGATGALAAEMADRYTIEAQYRGLVKKSFPGIGTAGITCEPSAGGAFHITGSGRVVHPTDPSKIFELAIDMAFRVEGGTVRCLASRNRCNKGSEDLRETIERVLPFVWLVQELPAPEGGKPHAFTTPHGPFRLEYGGSATHPEVSVRSGSAQVCKFFLTRSAAGQAHLDRFRIPGKDSVQLTFVSAAQTARVD